MSDRAAWTEEQFHLVILYRMLECGDTIPLNIQLSEYSFIEEQMEAMHNKGWVTPEGENWKVTSGGESVRNKMVEIYDHLMHFEVFSSVDLTLGLAESDTDEDGVLVHDHIYDPRFILPDDTAGLRREGVEDLRLAMMGFMAESFGDDPGFQQKSGGQPLDPYRMVFLQKIADGEFQKGNIWFDLRLGTPFKEVQEIVDSAYHWSDLDDDLDTCRTIMQDIYTAGMLEQQKRDGDTCGGCQALLGASGTGDDNTCPQCDTAFDPPVEEPEFSCPKCQADIYSGESRCKGCGAILDFSMPEGHVTTETVTETVEEVEESYGSCWSSGYDYGYCPYGYYDPYDPYLDVLAIATLCVIL